MPHRRSKNSLFELQSPPWFRSADLGFGRFVGSGSNSGCFASLCSNLWSGILELRSDLECLFRVGFRVEVMFCSCGVTSNFEFCRLLDINEARCGAIGFCGMIRASGLENKGFH